MINLIKVVSALFLFISSSSLAFASEGHGFSIYGSILRGLGVGEEYLDIATYVLAGLVSLTIILVVGIIYRIKVFSILEKDVIPQGKFSITNAVDAVLDFVTNIVDDVIGKEGKRFWTLLSAIFIFLIISDLMNLVPGLTANTASMSTNVAIGILVFVVYNYAGIKEHKGSYIKQFLGPIWWMAPLMIVSELLSHIMRPLSLSLRLYANLYADHMVVSIFGEQIAIGVPVVFLFFGLLVACLQAFIFTLLSSIYISMAISHDH